MEGDYRIDRTAAQRCQGKFILSTIDTHSNLDCLSALRGPERLCMDLVERPEAVFGALEQIDALFKPVYDARVRGRKHAGVRHHVVAPICGAHGARRPSSAISAA